MSQQPSRWQDQPEELWQLLQLTCDNQAQPEDIARLEAILQSDFSAQELYLAYLEIHAKLQWRYREEIHVAPSATQANVAKSPAPPVVPSSPRPAVPPSRTPVLGFLANISRHVPGGEFTVGSLLLLVIVAAFWGLSQAILYPRSGGHDLAVFSAGNEGETVATIRETSEVAWSKDGQSPLAPDKGRGAGGEGSAIAQNQQLQITSGLIELQLKQGATLLIEGPADWKINGANAATLNHGKLVAKVPKEAIGFTLETPAARIIDLGTEFGVQVAQAGGTEVEVKKGEVEVTPASGAPSRSSHATTRLIAGDRVLITAESGEVIGIDGPSADAINAAAHTKPVGGPTRLVDLRKTARATQSSTGGALRTAQHAIDGNKETYSHTALGDRAPWWQIDLGNPREIVAIAMHNRLDCCQARLRDLTIKILAEDGRTIVFESPLLNQDNQANGGIENPYNGPKELMCDVMRTAKTPIAGRYVRIERRPGKVARIDKDKGEVILTFSEINIYESVPAKPQPQSIPTTETK